MRTYGKTIRQLSPDMPALFAGMLLLFLYQSVAAAQSGADVLELQDEHWQHINQRPDLLAAEKNEQATDHDIQYQDKVVIVTFFASWCPPCLDEFSALNIITEKFGDDIAVVALNVFEAFDDNDEDRMKAFLQITQPEFRVLEGNPETRQLFGGVNRIPTLLVFDKAGKLAFHFIHKRGAKKQSVDASELINAIRPLIE